MLTAMTGDDVILPCDVHGRPDPVISWRKNRDRIDFFSMTHKYLLEDNGALVIPTADSNDSARYLCVAENEAGSLNQEISLIIYGQTNFIMVALSRKRNRLFLISTNRTIITIYTVYQ